MRLQGAVIKEQGVTFAVVIVKQHVLKHFVRSERSDCEFSASLSWHPVGTDGPGLKRHSDVLRKARHS